MYINDIHVSTCEQPTNLVTINPKERNEAFSGSRQVLEGEDGPWSGSQIRPNFFCIGFTVTKVVGYPPINIPFKHTNCSKVYILCYSKSDKTHTSMVLYKHTYPILLPCGAYTVAM